VSRIAAMVLGIEAVVIALAIPVAVTMSEVDTSIAVAVGLALSAACVLVAAFLRRGRIAYYLGSVLQLAAVLLGIVVPAMFVLGAIFATLWFVAADVARRDSGDA
jgi:hypothetical protein